MPFWRKRPQWPPLPSVEDEVESLAREWHGLSSLGDMPGIEGVCARGTVDQYPVIMDVFSNVETTIVEEFCREINSSDDSTGPPTPPGDAHLGKGPLRKFSVPMPFTSQKVLPQGQTSGRPSQSGQDLKSNVPGKGSRSAFHQLDSSPRSSRTQNDNFPAKSKDVPLPDSRKAISRAHTQNGLQYNSASSSVPRRSESVKSGRPLKCSATDTQQQTSASGYLSDTATVKHKAKGDRPEPIQPPQNQKTSQNSPNTPTLAERLEEKLRQRQEQRDSKSSAQGAGQDHHGSSVPLSATKPGNATAEPPVQGSQTGPASAFPKPDCAANKDQDPTAAPFATSVAPAMTNAPQRPFTGEVQEPRSFTSDELPAVRTRRAVSFSEVAPKPQSYLRNAAPDVVQQPQSSRSTSPQGAARQPSPSNSSAYLLPCPRSIPVAGYQDWFTIRGLTHLNICPSCLKQMRKSKFRDAFVLGNPRPRGEKIRCSMSEPWIRLAWMQTLKKQLDHLDLLHQIARNQSGNKPCTGRIISEQHWYRIIDPDTGVFLPKFNVCSGCVRNLRTLMPPHRDTFKRSTTAQARVCDFVTDSPRFVRYIDYLDIAANRSEKAWFSAPDLSEFMAYARRKVVLRDCRRDRLVLNTWHYMPQVPELTVCEDCYDDVVWPLVKANQPMARQFSALMRLPAGEGPSRCREASCQLYSPRMRARFRDAVQRDDLVYLKLIALRRYDAERRFRERREELLEDEARGYDCETELRKNLEEWKIWE